MTKQEMIDKLTEIDGYANEDVRLTMIDSVVTSLKKGIYPKQVLGRIETLIGKHQKKDLNSHAAWSQSGYIFV